MQKLYFSNFNKYSIGIALIKIALKYKLWLKYYKSTSKYGTRGEDYVISDILSVLEK